MKEFKGEIPEITIKENISGIFTYHCKKYGKSMMYPCRSYRNDFDDCYDCLGFNVKFERFFREKARCVSCTMRVDYGYFMLIYLLEKAGLLPSKFRMLCCVCRAKEQS